LFDQRERLDVNHEGGDEEASEKGEEGESEEGSVRVVVTNDGNTKSSESDEVETNVYSDRVEKQENAKDDIAQRNSNDQNGVR